MQERIPKESNPSFSPFHGFKFSSFLCNAFHSARMLGEDRNIDSCKDTNIEEPVGSVQDQETQAVSVCIYVTLSFLCVIIYKTITNILFHLNVNVGSQQCIEM